MTAVLLWKEYRQQRAFWLAIALLAVLLVASLGTFLGHGQGWDVFREKRVGETLTVLVVVLAVSYGVVSGALVLAGERDDGTLPFLDSLSALRGPLWVRKCLAGLILTLAEGMTLAALAVGVGFTPWPVALLLPLLALDAFAWGLLGGARSPRVLSAVLFGIGTMAASWLVLLWVGHVLVLALLRVGVTGTAAFLSWRRYTAGDRLRREGTGAVQLSRTLIPASVRVLVWLCVRQGRWTLVGAAALALVLAGTLPLAPFVIWPVGTIVLGLMCGLTTFVDDQGDGVRFLGAQRFPPGRIWTVKVGFWAAVLLVLTVAAGLFGTLLLLSLHPDQRLWRAEGFPKILDPVLLVALWPVYGFAIGHTFAQVMPRPVLAGMVAYLVAPLAVIWLPSLLFGGLHLWQVLVVPVALLILTRISQRAWLAGRLLTGRPLVVLWVGNLLTALGLAGALAYRVYEVPDVGEPFDVAGFVATLPTPEQNEAGRAMRKAAVGMHEQRTRVEKELPSLKRPTFPEEGDNLPAATGPAGSGPYGYDALLVEMVTNGWPVNPAQTKPWLDRVFREAWVEEARKAARLPLGMIQDPRSSDFQRDAGDIAQRCRTMGMLFTARALQLQTEGDSKAALQHLATALALARQMKNFATGVSLIYAQSTESMALSGYGRWLANAPKDPALLREAREILRKHREEDPGPANAIRATYLGLQQGEPVFTQGPEILNQLLATAYQAPWEKERQARLVRALVAGRLRACEQPRPDQETLPDNLARVARELGLPPPAGPGSDLSASTWGRLVFPLFVTDQRMSCLTMKLRRNTETLLAAEVATVVAIYQVDHGTPTTLDALVPDYFPSVPTDPVTGRVPGYHVSVGEKLTTGVAAVTLAPGQAVVSVPEQAIYFPVPYWKK